MWSSRMTDEVVFLACWTYGCFCMERLHRSKKDRILGGVFGGAAETYHLDPSPLRIAYAFLWLMTGIVPLGILYVIAWGAIPEAGQESWEPPDTDPS